MEKIKLGPYSRVRSVDQKKGANLPSSDKG